MTVGIESFCTPYKGDYIMFYAPCSIACGGRCREVVFASNQLTFTLLDFSVISKYSQLGKPLSPIKLESHIS